MPDRTHPWIDKRSLALGMAVAKRLESQPELLDVARKNLDSWIHGSATAPHPAHLEWRDILEQEELASIVELLRSESERAQRLRQSSPFAGILSPTERWRILKEYESQSA